MQHQNTIEPGLIHLASNTAEGNTAVTVQVTAEEELSTPWLYLVSRSVPWLAATVADIRLQKQGWLSGRAVEGLERLER